MPSQETPGAQRFQWMVTVLFPFTGPGPEQSIRSILQVPCDWTEVSDQHHVFRYDLRIPSVKRMRDGSGFKYLACTSRMG